MAVLEIQLSSNQGKSRTLRSHAVDLVMSSLDKTWETPVDSTRTKWRKLLLTEPHYRPFHTIGRHALLHRIVQLVCLVIVN